jgi:hypothetical protein
MVLYIYYGWTHASDHIYISASMQKWCWVIKVYLIGFSHSDIAGSKLVWQLPDAYRSHTTSFIAIESLGILRTPLSEFPVRNSENHLPAYVFAKQKCVRAIQPLGDW